MAALEKKLDAIKMLNFLNNENIKSNFSVEETAININGKFLSDKNGVKQLIKSYLFYHY